MLKPIRPKSLSLGLGENADRARFSFTYGPSAHEELDDYNYNFQI